MEPNEYFYQEFKMIDFQEEKNAAGRVLARLINRPEDRVDAGAMLDPEDFWDSVQLRVFMAVLECPALYNDHFAYDLERSLRERGDNEAANYVWELRRSTDFPYDRRDFLRQILTLHDLAAPRRAHDQEMQLMEEMSEEEISDDFEFDVE
jgi:hypothetical protein